MEPRGHGASERWVLLIGVALSTAVGIFFYVRTDLSTAMATFAGLVGTTITLQVESLLRERRASEHVTRQQRLIGQIESIDWLPDLLDQALKAIDVIDHAYGGTMAVELTRQAFDRCITQLSDLQRGHYITTVADNTPMYTLTARVQRSLRATSVDGTDLEWWLSPASRTYLRLQEEALQRHVSIQRIFIYRTWSDQLESLSRRLHDSGVRTLRVAQDELPPTLRRDLIIWDETCGYEIRTNAAGDPIDNTYTFAPQDLAVLIDRYDMIESCAEPWPIVTQTVG